ncbi:RmlC-like jelly roll fold [Vigna unguiculata]|uniref:RmlC-like jelly roll fold n=1 Tax=Vigna unguiculata TaxID=3917 RepID=A0A4D6MP26_VIGUN|nr:RmlC-like jelly roll fold [Vigna unguiculata]
MGDVFVFPIGLVHFQLNIGYGNAVSIVGLNSQSLGTIIDANALFKVVQPISVEVLTKALQVDSKFDFVYSMFSTLPHVQIDTTR